MNEIKEEQKEDVDEERIERSAGGPNQEDQGLHGVEEAREEAFGGRDVYNVVGKVGGDRREVYAVGCDKKDSK